MTFPTVTTEIAFVSAPMASPTWTDISAYVKEWSTTRGRHHELDRIETGTATLILKNSDDRFDPENAAGPYYGNIWPMRRVRITATVGGTSYPVFAGFVEKWGSSWPDKVNGVVQVDCVDGFKILNLSRPEVTYAQEKVEVRLANILDDADWTTGNVWVLDSATNSQLGTTTILGPNGDRLIDEGQSTIQAVTLSNTTGLQHMQDVVDTELGMAFISRDGTFVFHGRHRLWKPPYTTSQATFGDADPNLRYAEIVPSFDDSNLYNEVRVTRIGGSEQTASNTASQTKYLTRVLSQTNLLMTADTEALDRANFLLGEYKDLLDQLSGLPMQRIDSIILHPVRDDDLWAQALGREIGDRITIARTIAGSKDWRIEGVAHKVRPKEWETIFSLSPIDSKGFWVLDDPVYSVLGDTTRLAY